MNSSLVTIYITNHNYGKFIIQSIESVLNQSYREFELIIIDDGSTDNSIRIIDQYNNNKKIQIIKQKRKGLNATNNVALKNSKGKYIIRLDADDYLLENAIESMVDIIDSNDDLALVFPDYHIVDDEDSIIRTVRRHNFDKDVTLFDQPAHGACTMLRKSILIDIEGYDEEFDRQDGYDLWLKIFHYYGVKNINKPLFCYRQHSNNLTRNEFDLYRTRAKIKAKHVSNNQYESLDILTIIPVRGPLIDTSSNPLKKLGGKPLINWSIDSALTSKYTKNIIVSTPDLDIHNYIEETYNDKITLVKRNPDLARINVSIEDTVEESLSYITKNRPLPDAILILYIDYPFKRPWQIDETIHTMQIFNTDVVDGIRLDDRFYYQHDGGGLKPFIKDGGLHLERDQLYRRVGGIHLINTDFFIQHKKMIAGKIGHINFDQFTGFQIKSELDWEIARSLAKTNDV